jgi:hypothetical protein
LNKRRLLILVVATVVLAGTLATPAFAWHLWNGQAQSACFGHPASFQPIAGFSCGAAFPALYAPEVPTILVWPAAMIVALSGYLALERRRNRQHS